MESDDRWLYGWGLGYAAVGGASLLVPLYALSLGGGALLVGLLAATAALAGVPGAILWGRLAARTQRRRPFVLVALGATAAALAVMPLVTTPWPLLVANAALWFVVAAAAPVLNLVMVDGHPERDWGVRIGRLNAYQGYGWVVGLLVGAGWTLVLPRLVGGVGQRPLFLLLAGLAALGFVAVRVWYPSPTTVSADRFARVYRRLSREGWGAGRYLRTIPYGSGRFYWALRSFRPDHVARLRASPLRRYLLASALFSVGFGAFWAPMPAYLVERGYAAGPVFALFLVANVGSAVFYGRAGRLAGARDASTLQMAALLVRAALFPAVAVLGATALALPLLGGAFLLIGVTWAVIAVTATGLVTRLAPVAERGEALGLYTAMASLGTGVGSALGGWVAGDAGYVAAFGLAGVVGPGSAGLVWAIDRVPVATATESL